MMVDDEARNRSKEATRKHIDKVRSLILKVTSELNERGRTHDLSKLEEPELSLFAEWGPKVKFMEYGSQEYKEALEKMGEVLQHHYEHNRHHPEHHGEAGVDGMNLVDLIEMVCDWMASSQRAKDGDFMASLEHNRKRFNLTPQLVRIIANTAELLEGPSSSPNKA